MVYITYWPGHLLIDTSKKRDFIINYHDVIDNKFYTIYTCLKNVYTPFYFQI